MHLSLVTNPLTQFISYLIGVYVVSTRVQVLSSDQNVLIGTSETVLWFKALFRDFQVLLTVSVQGHVRIS
jgi:hypothetical protein